MSSIRYKTRLATLRKDVPFTSKVSMFGHGGMSDDDRKRASVLSARKVRKIRQVQQAESGLVEFPFELIPSLGGKVIKKAYMSDEQAGVRNATIRDLGLAWRRSGY